MLFLVLVTLVVVFWRPLKPSEEKLWNVWSQNFTPLEPFKNVSSIMQTSCLFQLSSFSDWSSKNHREERHDSWRNQIRVAFGSIGPINRRVKWCLPLAIIRYLSSSNRKGWRVSLLIKLPEFLFFAYKLSCAVCKIKMSMFQIRVSYSPYSIVCKIKSNHPKACRK